MELSEYTRISRKSLAKGRLESLEQTISELEIKSHFPWSKKLVIVVRTMMVCLLILLGMNGLIWSIRGEFTSIPLPLLRATLYMGFVTGLGIVAACQVDATNERKRLQGFLKRREEALADLKKI